MQLLQEIQQLMDDEIKVHPRDFKGRIILMSMYNDIEWAQKNNEDMCRQNLSCVPAYAKRFLTGCWTFLGSEDVENGTGLSLTNQKEKGTTQQKS